MYEKYYHSKDRPNVYTGFKYMYICMFYQLKFQRPGLTWTLKCLLNCMAGSFPQRTRNTQRHSRAIQKKKLIQSNISKSSKAMLGHYHQLLTAFYISRCRCNCICGACNYLKTEWWTKIKVVTETCLLLEPHNINTNMHALEVIMIFLSDNIRSRIVSCFRTGLILFAISFIFFIL